MIYFVSITDNVRQFVQKIGVDSQEIDLLNPLIKAEEPFILTVPSYENMITDEMCEFLEYEDNLRLCRGFAASGNINFDSLFGLNGKELSEKYEKPLLLLFEYEGTNKDVEKMKELIEEMGEE